MKRLISLLLIVITLSSLLVGCDIGKIWNSGTTTSPTTTTTKEPPIEAPFEHGDNFTAEDVEFVQYLDSLDGITDPSHTNFSDIISRMGDKTTLYTVKIDMQSTPCFICAYAPKDAQLIPFSFENGCVARFLIWYKFSDYNDIPEEIADQKFLGAFAIYDAVIERDIVNNQEYNRECKFFVPLYDGISEEEIKTQYGLYENVIIRQERKIVDSYEPIFIQNNLYQKFACYRDVYGSYVDNSGIQYFLLARTPQKSTDDSLDIESQIESLGSYYVDFLPHVEVFDTTLEKEGYDGSYICIKLDTFVEICFDK